MVKKGAAKAGTLYLVHVLTHATRARLDGMLTVFGLSSFQFTVLSVIAHSEDLSSARLSKRFHVTPQAMGELVLLLEKKGLVERKEDEKNRKILRLSLTAAGQEVWKAANAVVSAFERNLFAGRSESEVEAVRQFVTQALAQLRDEAGT